MNGKQIKKTLSSGGKVFGTLIESLGNPDQIVAYAQTGIDFVFIDNEHNPLDRNQTAFACQLFASCGIAPVVRIPNADLHLASMAIDGGAQGVIVPYVESTEDVWPVVAAAKYRPLKGRAVKRLFASERFPSQETKEHLEKINEDGFVVVMIESVQGIRNLQDILSFPEIDAILIGPHDLSIGLGVPGRYEDPVFNKAVMDVMRECMDVGVGFGIHLGQIDLHRRWIELGENFVVYSGDTALASAALISGLGELRKK